MKKEQSDYLGNDHYCESMPDDAVAIKLENWIFGIDCGAAVEWLSNKNDNKCPWCQEIL